MKSTLHEPYKKLKGWLLENDLKYEDVGKTLNINKSTVSAKINGQSDFYLSEVKCLMYTYGVPQNIFLH